MVRPKDVQKALWGDLVEVYDNEVVARCIVCQTRRNCQPIPRQTLEMRIDKMSNKCWTMIVC